MAASLPTATLTPAPSPLPPSAAPATARDRLALFILQVGALAVVLAAVPYKAFDLDRYFVPKELVLHVCATLAALLCLGVWRRLTANTTDFLLAAFVASSALSALMATNRWAGERALAITISGALLYWAGSTLRRVGLARPLLIALALGTVVAAATSLAQAYGVRTEYFSLNRAPGGTLGNRNFIAHLAVIGLPVIVLLTVTARRTSGALAGAAGVLLVAATLVLSRSRAAWLAVIVLGGVMLLLGFPTRRWWTGPQTSRRLAMLTAAAAIGAVAAVLIPNRLEWKSDSPYLDSAAGLVNYKEGSGRGRLVQYETSLKLTKANPLFGVGPGNWPVRYPGVAGRNDPSMSQTDDGTTSNPWPSSDLVADLSERGAIGFLLLTLLTLRLLGVALADLRRGAGEPERVLTAIALVGTLVATIVVGAVDAVLLIAVPTFFVWTLAGALSPPSEGRELSRTVRRVVPATVAVIGALTMLRSAGQLVAIATFSTSTRAQVLARAATFDPGSYRIRVRLAQAYLNRGDCARAKPQARAAHDLFPAAAEARRLVAACR